MAHLFRSRAGRLYETCVGLEVHVALLTASKLFSGAAAAAATGADLPNARVALFDAAHPGTLPRLNRAAVEQALRAALLLRCTIPRVSSFHRKHYFYADLPHGYQITQLDAPIAADGFFCYEVEAPGDGRSAPLPQPRVARIARLQLEMDAGKSHHGGARSLVDLNRAGAPLLEVVTEPDFRTPEEAVAFLRGLHAALVHVGVTRGAMEEGELRVDVNVSVRATAAAGGGGPPAGPQPPLEVLEEGAWWYVDGARHAREDASLGGGAPHVSARAPMPGGGECGGGRDGAPPALSWFWCFSDAVAAGAALASGGRAPAARPGAGFGARVEAKNLSTLRGVGACISAEAARQAGILEAGGAVGPETRAWDALRGTSFPLRSKGGAADYRFLPEADVEPVLVPRSALAALLRGLPPPLPALRRELLGAHGLRADEAEAVVGAPGVARAFLQVLRAAEAAAAAAGAAAAGGTVGGGLPRACAHWLCSELAGQLRAAAATSSGGGGGAGAAGGVAAAAAARPELAPYLGRLVWLVHSGAISGRAGKVVLTEMLQRTPDGGMPSPETVVETRGLALIRDDAAIAALCRAAVADPALAGAAEKWR
jgi:Asp-tRNA(Asn)/Glu-tRNA(Gln) amidotransferase B subunit